MANQAKFDGTNFCVGDIIKVLQKIQEEGKFRTQPFQGIVIAIKGQGVNKMFTVRKIAAGGIGVERIFPLLSPWIEKIEVMRQSNVRRAKLYYLRNRQGEAAVKAKPSREPIGKKKAGKSGGETRRKVSPKK
jgi:large subunit ribosomal protein L19